MEVSRTRALRGPNLWSRHTAIEAIVSCSEAECNIAQLSGYEARLRARFPQIGLLQLNGHAEAVPIARALELGRPGTTGASRLPSDFQPYHCDAATGRVSSGD